MEMNKAMAEAASLVAMTIRICNSVKKTELLMERMKLAAAEMGSHTWQAFSSIDGAPNPEEMRMAFHACYKLAYWYEVFANVDLIDDRDALEMQEQCETVCRLLADEYQKMKE